MDATARLLGRLSTYEADRPALNRIAQLENRLFSYAKIVGGVSDWVTTSLRQDYAVPTSKCRACPPCLDTSLFIPLHVRENNVSGGKMRLLFVGQDLRRKGGDLLLDAMANGLAGVCELHVVSDESPKSQLSDGVTWHKGLKPRSAELISQYQAADVFVLPTKEDCFPMVLIEAMACGVPLISTDVMGVPELVADGVNGISISPSDSRALVGAIRTLAEQPALRHQMGRASRKLACEKFSFAASTKTWRRLFADARDVGSERDV